jgi:hypothetical protein
VKILNNTLSIGGAVNPVVTGCLVLKTSHMTILNALTVKYSLFGDLTPLVELRGGTSSRYTTWSASSIFQGMRAMEGHSRVG